MRAYVTPTGRTLLVLAALRGTARVFASEPPRPGRRVANAPPAPPPEERAADWVRERGAGELVWAEQRVCTVQMSAGPIGPALDGAMMAVSLDMAARQRRA